MPLATAPGPRKWILQSNLSNLLFEYKIITLEDQTKKFTMSGVRYVTPIASRCGVYNRQAASNALLQNPRLDYISRSHSMGASTLQWAHWLRARAVYVQQSRVFSRTDSQRIVLPCNLNGSEQRLAASDCETWSDQSSQATCYYAAQCLLGPIKFCNLIGNYNGCRGFI